MPGTFQLTHSRGVRRRPVVEKPLFLQFQLTHSRGVRLQLTHSPYCAIIFQLTHSRGVRRTYDIGISAENKFQLTHSRGVRPFIISQNEANGNFNSRTHVECDDSAARKHSAVLISTHALTWSATEGWVDLPRLHENFNSRTHVECDSPPLHLHTIPRHFNSRTHVECDCPKVKCPSSGLISTHALTWSATQRRQSFVHG